MIDLHTHTTYSDGTMTPTEILKKAEAIGIKLLSFTDHNRVDAYLELTGADIRKVYSGKLISGVEFTTILFGQVIELLGYGFEPNKIVPFIERCYGSREEFMYRELYLMYSTYEKLGVRLEKKMTEFSVKEHGTAKRFVFSQLLNEENTRFFADVSNCQKMKRYIRGELYNPESPLYIDYGKILPSPSNLAEEIHRAGGKVFLAHCFLYTERIWGCLDEVIKQLPVDGMEVWYSSFSEEQSERLENFCLKNNLLMSGGSDFHGDFRPSVSLGNNRICKAKIDEWGKQYYENIPD